MAVKVQSLKGWRTETTLTESVGYSVGLNVGE